MLTPAQQYALQGLVTWLARNADLSVNEDEDTPITNADAHAALATLIKQTPCIANMQTDA